MRRSLALIVLALSAWGCGARTELFFDPDAVDVSTDAAADVTGDHVVLPDAMRDATPDAPSSRCTRNADCAGTPATPVCDVTSGICVECVTRSDCPAGEACVNFLCQTSCAGGGPCPTGRQCCDDFCTSTASDTNNCGGCGVVCAPFPHSAAACSAAMCAEGPCDPGFAECDGIVRNGCETSVFSDPANCGGCRRACAPGQTCSGGTCVGACQPGGPGCAGGLVCCDNQGACPTCGPTCTNTTSDLNNCGGCNRPCGALPNATVNCAGGTCAIGSCTPGFADCDGNAATGCEVRLATDHNNCGGCGTVCGREQACSGGVCVDACDPSAICPAGTTCCTSFCANLDSDPNNCGGCGLPCRTVPNASIGCGAGRCVIAACSPGFGDCDGQESDGCETPLDSNANCGGCGVACGPNSQCIAGTCRPTGCGAGPACSAGQSCCGDLCVNSQTDSNNCGGCNVRCSAGQSCVAGSCRASGCPAVPCAANQGCCAGTCVDIHANDPNNCGGCNVSCMVGQVCMMGACCTANLDAGGTCGAMVCPGTQLNCSGICRDTQNDPSNCGGCDIRCQPGQSCVGGFCRGCPACPPGDACCNDTCADTQNDPNNCGGCGTTCRAGQRCVMGGCTSSGCVPDCAAGLFCCDVTCVNEASDPNNCGGCGAVCPSGPNATAFCSAQTCGIRCNAGFGDCDGNPANGCESSTSSDANNCGGCGLACSGGQRCVNGACMGCGACSAGTTCCDNTTCVNTQTDPTHCGGCTTRCAAPVHASALCTAGLCGFVCNAGFGDCNGNPGDGCEVDESSDANNCGGCNIRCPMGMACSMGSCVMGPSDGSEGAFLPIANPTYLSPGVHNFTTITIPAGSVVFVAGAGAQSATLDLRANGHVQIDGTIDVSGGPGTQSVVASRSTQQGKAGSGGFTGEGTSAPQPAASCEFVGGEPGQRGAMVMGTAGSCPVFSSSTCTDRNDPRAFIFTSPVAQYGGGGGVFTGFRAYGAGGGGFAGGAGGALGAAFSGEQDCAGVTGGGGAASGRGGRAGVAAYDAADGSLGQTQCDAVQPGIPRAWVGGGGGGSIGTAAAGDLAVNTTFVPGSGGGGGSADYLQRPAFGGTSGGGGGGGALRIWTSADIVVTGSLLANGGTGGDAYIGTPGSAGCDPQPGAAGGGGSGGLIYLKAPAVNVSATARVSAAGGLGGAGSVFATGGGGGNGGVGRVRISATQASCTLAGSFTPALVAGCAPTTTPTPGRAYVGAYPN